MKAITLWEPWASYIACGMKRYETRSWATRYRGPLAIHAANRRLGEDEADLLIDWPLPDGYRISWGAVIAICRLADCQRTEDAIPGLRVEATYDRELDLGNWGGGRFAWRLEAVERLEDPVFVRGRQGLWEWDARRVGR
jgi:hypothetical protein